MPASQRNQIVQAALNGGVNWFDTAELYGWGRSERGLAEALTQAGKTNAEVRIATKWNPMLRTARPITRTIRTRQTNLEGYTIDLYQIHAPVSFATRRSEMNAMADLVDSGQIGAIGVSNFNARQMRRAHEILHSRGMRLAANQVRYNLADRRIESNGILDTAKELGITIIAYSPLFMGLLSGKFHSDPQSFDRLPIIRRRMLHRRFGQSGELVNALEQIARAHGTTAAQVALNWLINAHGDTVVAIPGASTVSQAKENAEAMRFTLTDQEAVQIDALSREIV